MDKTCGTCRWWGAMGKCSKQSGMRSFGGVSWHQLVTTDSKDTCPQYNKGSEA